MAGGIVLAEESFEPEKPFGLGNALRRRVAGRAAGCVELGASLALVQVSLRSGRGCESQCQTNEHQLDTTTRHRHRPQSFDADDGGRGWPIGDVSLALEGCRKIQTPNVPQRPILQFLEIA